MSTTEHINSTAENSREGPRSEPNTSCVNTNRDQMEPSVTTKPAKKALSKGKKQKTKTSVAGNDASRKSQTQSGDVNSRLDKLEGLLEHIVSAMYTDPEEEGHVDPIELEPNGSTNVSTGTDENIVNSPREHCSTEKSEAVGFAAKFACPTESGPPIGNELAQSVNFLMENKLEEKQLTQTCENYPKPQNCNLVIPKVNPLIWENLGAKTRTMDVKIQNCQKPLVKGITAVLKNIGDRKTTEAEEDSIALLANANYQLNLIRKDLIKPELNQRYAHLCKPNVKSTEWLFGDDLTKTVKDLDEQQKTAGVMRQPKTRFSQRFNPLTPQQKYASVGWGRRTAQSQRPFLGASRYLNSNFRYQNNQRPAFTRRETKGRNPKPSGGKNPNRH